MRITIDLQKEKDEKEMSYDFYIYEVQELCDGIGLKLSASTERVLNVELLEMKHSLELYDVMESTYKILHDYEALQNTDPEMTENCKYQVELKVQQLDEAVETVTFDELQKREAIETKAKQEFYENFQKTYEEEFQRGMQ